MFITNRPPTSRCWRQLRSVFNWSACVRLWRNELNGTVMSAYRSGSEKSRSSATYGSTSATMSE